MFSTLGHFNIEIYWDWYNTFNHEYRNCAIVILFDSPSPAVTLYFCRFTSQTQRYTDRDIGLLRLLRATLLQTIKAIIYQEECQILHQILNYLPDQDKSLAVISDEGSLVYKSQTFGQVVGYEQYVQLLIELTRKTVTERGDIGCTCYRLQLGQSLYEVTLTAINVVACDSTGLNLLSLSRVTDKKLKINQELDKAGLSSRELEIAALIFQGLSAHNISRQLNISYHTVRNHIKHIYYKMGVSTRSEMLTWGN